MIRKAESISRMADSKLVAYVEMFVSVAIVASAGPCQWKYNQNS